MPERGVAPATLHLAVSGRQISTRLKPPSSATWAPSRPAPCPRPSAASASRPSAPSSPTCRSASWSCSRRLRPAPPRATDPRRPRRAGQPAAPGHRARPRHRQEGPRAAARPRDPRQQPRRHPADLPHPHTPGTSPGEREKVRKLVRSLPLAGLEPATCCLGDGAAQTLCSCAKSLVSGDRGVKLSGRRGRRRSTEV